MTKEKWRWVLNIIYLIVTIVTLIYTIKELVYVVQYPSQDDILTFGPVAGFVLTCVLYSIFFIAEYGVYSSLKYFLFAEEKKATRLIWEIIKIALSIMIFINQTFFTYFFVVLSSILAIIAAAYGVI